MTEQELEEEIDRTIYVLVDLRIESGRYRAEDREKHFADLKARAEWVSRKVLGGEKPH